MVKNFKGGSKHKKFARKNVKGNSEFDERVRKSEHKDEIYASVAKILGNGRVEILCNDGKSRQCIIRNKFRGKNKRNNELTSGTIILAGRRGWETPNDTKMETCDLLCVYNNTQVNKLKTEPNVNMGLLQSTSNTVFDKKDTLEFFDRGLPNYSDEESADEADADEDGADADGADADGEDNTIIHQTSNTEDVISLMNIDKENMINVDEI